MYMYIDISPGIRGGMLGTSHPLKQYLNIQHSFIRVLVMAVIILKTPELPGIFVPIPGHYPIPAGAYNRQSHIPTTG